MSRIQPPPPLARSAFTVPVFFARDNSAIYPHSNLNNLVELRNYFCYGETCAHWVFDTAFSDEVRRRAVAVVCVDTEFISSTQSSMAG